MAKQVPLNLNLMEHLGTMLELTLEDAKRRFPYANYKDLEEMPMDLRFYEVGFGGQGIGKLVIHHSYRDQLDTCPPQDGPGIWEVWTGEIYWSQLNADGEEL